MGTGVSVSMNPAGNAQLQGCLSSLSYAAEQTLEKSGCDCGWATTEFVSRFRLHGGTGTRDWDWDARWNDEYHERKTMRHWFQLINSAVKRFLPDGKVFEKPCPPGTRLPCPTAVDPIEVNCEGVAIDVRFGKSDLTGPAGVVTATVDFQIRATFTLFLVWPTNRPFDLGPPYWLSRDPTHPRGVATYSGNRFPDHTARVARWGSRRRESSGILAERPFDTLGQPEPGYPDGVRPWYAAAEWPVGPVDPINSSNRPEVATPLLPLDSGCGCAGGSGNCACK